MDFDPGHVALHAFFAGGDRTRLYRGLGSLVGDCGCRMTLHALKIVAWAILGRCVVRIVAGFAVQLAVRFFVTGGLREADGLKTHNLEIGLLRECVFCLVEPTMTGSAHLQLRLGVPAGLNVQVGMRRSLLHRFDMSLSWTMTTFALYIRL